MLYGVADCISFDDTPNGPADPGAHRASDPRSYRVADSGPDNHPDTGADDKPNGPADPGAHSSSDPRPYRVADPGPDNRPDTGADAQPDAGPHHLRAYAGTNLRLPAQLW